MRPFVVLSIVSALCGRADAAFLDVAGGRLHYEVAGRGPAVVLIHGGLVDSRMWDDQRAWLARRYTVITYDHRGFGQSPQPHAPYSPVGDLRALLDHLHVQRAAIVGLSYGGQVAIDFTLEYPDRVAALVTAGATVRGLQTRPVGNRQAIYAALERRGVDAAVTLWLKDPAFATAAADKSVAARLRTMLAANAPGWGHLDATLRTWPRRTPATELSTIHVPTLVIVGALDNPNIHEAARLMRASIKNVTCVEIPGAGHHVNMERPREFDLALAKFLDEHMRDEA